MAEYKNNFLHDLKNPLSIAHGHCRLLLKTTEAATAETPADLEAVRTRVRKIYESLELMDKMIEEHRKERHSQQASEDSSDERKAS